MDNNDKKIRNLILILIIILSVLFFTTEGFFIYGIVTVFCGVLYVLWNKDNKNNNDDDYYKFNFK